MLSGSKRAKKIYRLHREWPAIDFVSFDDDRCAEIFRLFDHGFVADHIAGAGFAFDAAMGELGEHYQFAELIDFAYQQAAALGHALGHKAVGHDGIVGQMLEQVVFAKRDALHCGGVRTTDKLGEPVEPEPTHGEGDEDAGGGMQGARHPDGLMIPPRFGSLRTGVS